ncbi:MAG: hydantoinase/oxoprolinase family protein [Acidimicrobiia bacterium]|nr:hydantoinase/oxoprolinase family protein [Acidimicrobiia bacterium]
MSPATDRSSADTISVDIGGTFTDAWVVHRDRSVHGKAPTTRYDLSVGFLDAVAACAEQLEMPLEELLADTGLIRYATTLAMNALLERKGPRLGMITTAGFEDTTSIGRGAWHDGLPMEVKRVVARADRPEPLVPRDLVVGVRERVDSLGNVVVPIRREEVREKVRQLVDRGAMGFVVLFLWSFLRPDHEQVVREEIEAMFPEATLGAFPAILSSDVLPKTMEYQRSNTTILSAYLHRDMAEELAELGHQLLRRGYRRPLWLVNNSGGCVPLHRSTAIDTYNAGPIGGLVGSMVVARHYGYEKVIVTDMGGTSFDIGHATSGQASLRVAGAAYEHFYAATPTIGRWRVGISMIETTSIGAGGGSIASVNEVLDNLLEVGPRSAGSLPGPACFERGGKEPTVTDADVVLGFIDPNFFLGGAMKLNRELAEEAIKEHVAGPLGLSVEEAAWSIKTLIDAKMGNEIYKETNLKGLDPRQFVLFAYGGAGPTHATGYARAVRVPRIVTFPQSSVFSAFGISTMDFTRVYERSRSLRLRQPDSGPFLDDFEEFNAVVDSLVADARRDLADLGSEEEATLRLEVDMRYGMQPNVTRIRAPKLRLESVEDARALHDRFAQEYGRIFSPAAVYPQGGVDIETFAVWVTLPMRELRLEELPLGPADPSAARKGRRPVYFGEAWVDTPVFDEPLLVPGNEMDGPAIIEAVDTTIVVPPGWHFQKDRYGNGVIEEVG